MPTWRDAPDVNLALADRAEVDPSCGACLPGDELRLQERAVPLR